MQNETKDLLAELNGLTSEQTATMTDGDWEALRSRMLREDPPDSDVRVCLAYCRVSLSRSMQLCSTQVIDILRLASELQAVRGKLEAVMPWDSDGSMLPNLVSGIDFYPDRGATEK